tara:strand:- start:14941 stop:16059 length:1119 start_codon:yes stop_codon:yes gene_type:complete
VEQDCDIIIIGGGLAGLTAAVHLLQADFSVMLIEKNSYPKHKVCGEYVSNEVLPYLDALGIYPLNKGAKKINRFQFSGLTGNALEIKLPLGGFGISRYALDLALYERAISLGLVFEQATATNVTFGREQFEVTTKDKSFRAPYALGAYGKRSGLDITLSRKFISTKSPWMGVKAHYAGQFPEDLVALHNFSGGYCGLSKVETDAINVCYLADVNSFKKHKDLDTYRVKVLEQNRYLKEFFAQAEPIFEKPLTISQISFQDKSAVENHILMIGDSAGLIHPLCGNGMAMAIHSAKIASECLIRHLQTSRNREQLEKEYTKEWKRTFATRMRNGALIQRGLHNATITRLGVGILQKSPRLLSSVIQSTHGNLIT